MKYNIGFIRIGKRLKKIKQYEDMVTQAKQKLNTEISHYQQKITDLKINLRYGKTHLQEMNNEMTKLMEERKKD